MTRKRFIVELGFGSDLHGLGEGDRIIVAVAALTDWLECDQSHAIAP